MDAEIDELEDGPTRVIDRGPKGSWRLALDTGETLPLDDLTSVILGRAPGRSLGGIRGLAVPDKTKTLSKVHARLDRDGDTWTVTDLGSTNGVLLGEAGAERPLGENETAPLLGRFVLGELGLRVERAAG
ncbi:MAG: FHA domain-containing protein [Microbacteriaceae bacterium]|nr:FHA domain-containing protein [Microbacteriaceae bacterium]